MPSYFCHQCERQVQLRNTDLVCNDCGGDFLEEVTASTNAPSTAGPAQAAGQNEPGEGGGAPPEGGLDILGLLQSLLEHRLPQNPNPPQNPPTATAGQAQTQAQQQTAQAAFEARISDHVRHVLTQLQAPPGGQRTGVGFGAGGGGGAHGHVTVQIGIGPNGQMQFNLDPLANLHGNPADYAWGANGMDHIMTQLMNAQDGIGRVGISQQQLANMPMAEVDQKHVDNGTQCTTCFETFALGDSVAKLTCDHIFHRECIEPWLLQRASCPICRQEVKFNEWPQTAPPATSGSSAPATASRLMDTDDLD